MSQQTTIAVDEEQAALAAWQAMLRHPSTKARLEGDLFGTLQTLAHVLKQTVRTPAAAALADRQLAEINELKAERPELVKATNAAPSALALAAGRAQSHQSAAPRAALRNRSARTRRKGAHATVGSSSGGRGDPPREDEPPGGVAVEPEPNAFCSDCSRGFHAAGKRLTRYLNGHPAYCPTCSDHAAEAERSRERKREICGDLRTELSSFPQIALASACFKCGKPASARRLHGATRYEVDLEVARRSVRLCDDCFKPTRPRPIALIPAGRVSRSYESEWPPGFSLEAVAAPFIARP
ncbi:MAG: hypothetical protein ACJ752_00630 [Gaiellaceae bacterium]